MKLSDVSPLAAMMTGEGTMGKLMAKGFGGAIPAMFARQAQKDAAEEARQQAVAESGQAQPMKKGGMVSSSASKRADGCAQRGKTKGRII